MFWPANRINFPAIFCLPARSEVQQLLKAFIDEEQTLKWRGFRPCSSVALPTPFGILLFFSEMFLNSLKFYNLFFIFLIE